MKYRLDKLSFLLAAVIVLVMAAATWIESFRGTSYVSAHFYGSSWFVVLWGLLCLSALPPVVRRLRHHHFAFLIHLSFVIILAGALTTHLTSRRGLLHLREHLPVQAYKAEGSGSGLTGESVMLPFTLTLRSFRVVNYPGTDAPQDYVSRFDCLDHEHGKKFQGEVSMNRIFRYSGYRLYQSSYDPDLKGSWLSVNYDPYGIPVTYTGYALLALSMLGFLVSRAGQLKALLRSPCLHRTATVLCLLFLLPVSLAAEGKSDGCSVVELRQADEVKCQQVVYNGRVAPVNTMALDFVKKMTGRRTYRGLTPEQVMLSWMLYPDEWQYVPMIKLKGRELPSRLGIEGSYARFIDFFDQQGNYKLEKWLQEQKGMHTPFHAAVEQADEKVGIILMVTKGELGRPVAAADRLPESKVKAEIFYNAWPVQDVLFMVNLALGLVFFAAYMMGLVCTDRDNLVVRISSSPLLWHAGEVLLFLSVLLLSASFGLRWYISGHIPLSNGYETMQFMALAIACVACVFSRRFRFVLPSGFLLSGIMLLVCHISGQNPQITQLMPVLHSPWLSSHVSFVMMSYSLFSFMLILSGVALVLDTKAQHHGEAQTLTTVSRILLYPATFLLAVGIFLGAVWANVSWGSYWSWDPKEVWALITMLVYGAAFHTRSLPFLATDRWFNLYVVLSFMTILMTYFGVNYLLGGMHSYAQ